MIPLLVIRLQLLEKNKKLLWLLFISILIIMTLMLRSVYTLQCRKSWNRKRVIFVSVCFFNTKLFSSRGIRRSLKRHLSRFFCVVLYAQLQNANNLKSASRKMKIECFGFAKGPQFLYLIILIRFLQEGSNFLTWDVFESVWFKTK